MSRQKMPHILRTRILFSCVGCMLVAMLIQMLLFNASSSGVISAQTASINQSTLKNLTDDVYSSIKSVEDSLVGIYAHKDFLRALGANPANTSLQTDYSSMAYEISSNDFSPSQNLTALYIYTMDHTLVSSYRHAQTPIYTYPEDIYNDSMRGSDVGIKAIVAENPPVMVVTSYYNNKRNISLVRFVLRILENGQTPIGYMVCDVDPKGIGAIMKKYRYADEQSLWLQSQGNSVLASLPDNKQVVSAYTEVSKSNATDTPDHLSDSFAIYSLALRKYDVSVYSMIPLTTLNANQSALLQNMLFVFALVLVVFSGLFLLISKQLTKPLTQMMDTMKRIKQGETTLRLPQMRQDELGILGGEFNEMLDRIQGFIAKQYQTAMQLNDVKYKALQMQVNPHFLYNTLDTMSAIAISKDCPLVGTLCQALSGMFRYSLNMSNQLATLGEELRHLKNYLFVMNVRMQNSLHLTMDIPAELLEARLPRLTLQPLVENAIQHGLHSKRGEKKVHISAELNQDELTICVADNGVGMAQETIDELLAFDDNAMLQKSKSIGLSNIHSRLKLLFGEKYGVCISSRQGEGSRVMLRIPYSKEEGSRD